MLRRLLKPDRQRTPPPQRPTSLIVGLGNPGAKYQHTRHNLGFMVIDKLGSSIDASSRERFQGAILETRRNDETLVLLKPLTFMNNSGASVSQVTRWYKVPHERILIIYDDLDLPYGTIRLRPGGSAGGHNGLASVIQHLGTDNVPRLRIGIGRPVTGSTVNYVLTRFSKDEQGRLAGIVDTAADVATCWLNDGIQVAMNRFNRTTMIEAEDMSSASPSRPE
jgi:peptidyl-tRNA hydrolase, PTH1 family